MQLIIKQHAKQGRHPRLMRGLAAGFSMVEVLVTLVVLSVGFLGLAKMQAASVSNTQIARTRSLIALQASSMASSMRSNKNFWSKGLAPATITIENGAASYNQGNSINCLTNACSPTEMASYDLADWSSSLNTHFPGATAKLNCSTETTKPISCQIQISWAEKYVAINTSTTLSSSDQMMGKQSFTLHVEP